MLDCASAGSFEVRKGLIKKSGLEIVLIHRVDLKLDEHTYSPAIPLMVLSFVLRIHPRTLCYNVT